LDTKALTKVNTAVLIAVIIVAAVSGGVGYVLWRTGLSPSDDIKITRAENPSGEEWFWLLNNSMPRGASLDET
jgi:hypothetical protein